jgi:hypothetical protein
VGSITNTCGWRRDPIGRINGRHNYNRTRTHLSLTKDTPDHRTVQRPSEDRVIEVPRVGGLHHEYGRHAA